MNEKTKAMICGWINDNNGDVERTSQWVKRLINCGIKDARRMVAEAVN